ncbi:BQ2448_3451 [Microbotryum intermedium]|uniref:sn-1-specific diacylglycerol lipase n=1 Tax=Microbotryum intermedium TaxID=269621 RepID=A0A238FD42_9BASI|nr:BQ2448_3451 [Microbotryum intermedium]
MSDTTTIPAPIASDGDSFAPSHALTTVRVGGNGNAQLDSLTSPSRAVEDDREAAPGRDISNVAVLATPAFLKCLQPPPLPLWAVPHTTTALTASRLSLLSARSFASTGFAIARTSTSLGFGAVKAAVAGIGVLLDHSLGLNGNAPIMEGSGPLAQTGIAAIAAAEKLALLGINIGSGITNLALGGATSTIAFLEDLYGNDEALRTLEAFTRLVKDEWTTSRPTDPYPEGGLSHWSTIQVAKAAATWAALQSVTCELDGRRFAMHLDELDWGKERIPTPQPGTGGVLWEITDDQLFKSGAEITEATINQDDRSSQTGSDATYSEEHARQQLRRFASMCLGSYGSAGVLFFGVKLPSIDATIAHDASSTTVHALTPDNLAALARQQAEEELERALRPQRHSGVPSDEVESEAAQLGDLAAGWALPAEAASAVEAVEIPPGSTVDQTEATSDTETTSALQAEDWGLKTEGALPRAKPTTHEAKLPRYDYWGLLTGKHDEAILHSVAGVAPDATLEEACDSSDDDDDDMTDVRPDVIAQRKNARVVEREARKRREMQGRRPPRFFILQTDHPNRSITVLLRGTTTIDDIATDLACESSVFDETQYWDDPLPPRSTRLAPYTVHGGMYEIAIAMGRKDGAVHRVVDKALRRNPGYGLQLAGRSLGSGCATLLGLMWANPDSATISSKSGLPAGRSVQVFGFATPCVTDAALSMRCRKLVHSFVYSFDVVPRFSLGHMRDIRSAVAWLCYANSDHPEESCDNILSRIVAYKRGKLDDDPTRKKEEEDWVSTRRVETKPLTSSFVTLCPARFTSIRTSLEANQNYSTLCPPGDVLWLTKPDDLILPSEATRIVHPGPRLFRVSAIHVNAKGWKDVIFKQMIFTRNMLSSHLPHQYVFQKLKVITREKKSPILISFQK